MNREEFQKIVDETTGKDMTSELRVRWETGGAHGGNCWDDTPPSAYTSSDPEPEFEDLDIILMELSPTMSFLQYKLLSHKIEYDTDTDYEYYGNYTSYGTKTISVNDIWNFLVEQELVEH